MKFPLLALSLLALAPNLARAEGAVAVRWAVNFTKPDGSSSLHQTPRAYLETLERCGHRPRDLRYDLLPASILRCPGVLEFKTSANLVDSVVQRLDRAEKNGSLKGISLAQLKRQARTVTFGISRYGIFESLNDGVGNARRMGVNLSAQRLVVLNDPFWRQLAKSPDRDLFLLHETLGALGIEDRDYEVSLAVMRLSQGDSSAQGSVVKHREARSGEGGVTVVGHGGDVNQLLIKASLMKAADKQLRIEGSAAKRTPTPAEIKAVISRTKIIMMSKNSFVGKTALCLSFDTREMSETLCGGFSLRGADGAPVVIAPDTFGEFTKAEQVAWLTKIFSQIVEAIVRS